MIAIFQGQTLLCLGHRSPIPWFRFDPRSGGNPPLSSVEVACDFDVLPLNALEVRWSFPGRFSWLGKQRKKTEASQLTDSQKAFIIKQGEDGTSVVDTCSRFVPVLDPRFSYRGEDVVATLEQVCSRIGFPKTIRGAGVCARAKFLVWHRA